MFLGIFWGNPLGTADKMTLKRLLFTISGALFFLTAVFAEIAVISPSEGVWANKQMLVLDSAAGSGDYYYSIDGSDPQVFGFAYDGPVLLDVTGDVRVRIARISKDGPAESTQVDYTVKPDNASGTDYRGFVSVFYESGILNYSSGSKIHIPSSLMYSLGSEPYSFIPGQTISLSAHNVLSRYVPCVVFDSVRDVRYRFIIRTLPHGAGSSAFREVPFTVTDWDTIDFVDQNMLYKIDSEFWGLPSQSRTLDRSKSHMIFWQPLEHFADNSVEFFVLPPKPRVIRNQFDDGSVTFSVHGDDSYTLSVYSKEAGGYQEQFASVGADVFYGDRISESVTIGVFADSVYQGKITTKIEIDKKPPAQPEIVTSARAFYSRDSVRVDVSSAKDCELYVALSQPYSLNRSDEVYSADSSFLRDIPAGEFRRAKSDSFSITWNPRANSPVYYKLRAYAKCGNNTSLVSEYSVIIDQSSYYFDAGADGSIAEGTALHPFTDFEQCQELLSSVRSVHLRVKGEMRIDRQYSFQSNLQIENDGEAVILFGPEGSLEARGGVLEISDCRIQNSADSRITTIIPLIKLENAVCNLANCEISFEAARNGTVIDSYNSILTLSGVIASASASSYAALISGVKSRIKMTDCVAAVFADTAVVISASDGTLEAVGNAFSVTGRTGRIAELFGVRAKITSGKFRGSLRDNSAGGAVFAGKNTVLYQDDNESLGF